jgi:hypothetical protein
MADNHDSRCVGKFIREEPGSGGEKQVKHLDINADGTVGYKLIGENAMESFEVTPSGPTHWRIRAAADGSGDVVDIVFEELTKVNKAKGGMSFIPVSRGETPVWLVAQGKPSFFF